MDRGDAARRKVLDGAVRVLEEAGVPGFTVEAVARRAGVAKTTVYRHWPKGHGLLVDTIRHLVDPIPTPNTGSLADDLEQLLVALVPCTSAEVEARTRVMFSVLQAAADDPDLWAAVEELLHERSGPIRTVVELARARGDVPADLDLDLAVDMVEGPFLHRFVLRREPVDAGEIDRLRHLVVAALTAG